MAVDTGDVTAKTNAAATSISALVAKLTGIPQAKIGLDIGNAEQAAGTLNKTLSSLLGTVGLNTTALSGLTAALGAGGLVAGAGAAVVALGALGAEMKSLDRQMQNLTGATGPRLDQMRADFNALFRSVPADGGDIVKAQVILQQEFRQTGEAAVATIQALSGLSRVMGGDLANNTKEVAAIFNAWQVDTKDQVQTISDLVKVSQATGQSLGELSAGLARGGLAGKELGLSLKETGVFMDVVSDAGLQSRAVFGALREAMAQAAASGGDTTNFFKEQVAAIRQMDSAAEQAAAASLVFGKQAGPQLAVLIRQGRLEIEDMVDEIDAMQDPLATGFARGTTASAQFQVAINNLKKDLTPAGLAVIDFAAVLGTDLVLAINGARQAIQDFMSSGAVQAFLDLRQTVTGSGAGQVVQGGLLGFIPGVGPFLSAASAMGVGRGGGGAGDAAQELPPVNEALKDMERRAIDSEKALAALRARLAETAPAVASLAEQLKAAATGGNAPLVESLLRAETQVKSFDTAMTQLTDRTLAANLLVLRAQAEAIGNATGDWTAYDAAVTAAAEHLDVQKATQEAATAATKEATKAQEDIEAAMTKAASVAGDTYAARLNDLATAVLPNLDAAMAVSLKQALLLGDQQTALGIIATATGQDQATLAAAITGTGAAAQEATQHAAALAKGFAGFLTEEETSRWRSGISGLTSAVDAATAAQAKLLDQTGHTKDALELLLQTVGAGDFAGRLAAQIQAGGAAAQDAREKIAALTTFVREHGQMVLKIDVDLANAQKALGDLQANFREANAKRVETEMKAQRAFDVGQQQAADTRAGVQREFRDQILGINQARQDSQAQVGRDITSAASAANDAARKLDQTIDDAIAKHVQAVADARAKYAQAVGDAAATLAQGMQGLADRTADVLKQIGEAAAGALRAQSSAMQSFNDQQRQALNAQSIGLQNAQLQAIAAQPGFIPDQRSQQNLANVAAVQKAGTEALAQQAQANQLNQTLQSTNQALQKATEKAAAEMGKLSEQMAKLMAAFQKSTDAAARTQEKAIRDASQAEEKTIRDANKGLAANNEKLVQAQSKALEENQKRQKALDDQQQAATQKWIDDLVKDAAERARDPKGRGRTAAEIEFEQAQEDRLAAQRKAEKDFKEQQDKLQEQIDNLKAIKLNTDKFTGPSVQFGQTTIQETSKDMLAKAAEVAKIRLRV